MTPERLEGLAALLLDFREWLAEDVRETVEQQAVDYVIAVIAQQRLRLVLEVSE